MEPVARRFSIYLNPKPY
ncbi:unnamed protein product, partial [Adineta steineri]